MLGKTPRSVRHMRLSPRAAFAAERLAEIAGVPAIELVEMVILELAASGEVVEADFARMQRRKPVATRGPAAVIPIERGRRGLPGSLQRRVEALRQRSEVARRRSVAACQESLALRLKRPLHLDGEG